MRTRIPRRCDADHEPRSCSHNPPSPARIEAGDWQQETPMPGTYATTLANASYLDYATTTFVRPPIFMPPTLGYYIDGTDGNDSLSGSKGADEIHGHGGN